MFQRGYRALVLWISWTAAALIIYVSIYHDTDVLTFVQNDSSRITWAILGLFAVGVITSLALTLMLTRESVTIDKLEKAAIEKGWPGIEQSPKTGTVARFFQAIRSIMQRNGEVNVEALVDVEFAMYQRAAHALEIIGNLLITLGLVGTVVGLTLTLSGLTGSLEALGENQNQMMSGLRSAMGGMGTAFYTTLLGSVLGGVLLRIYGHIDEHGVESLENALTRICLVYCSADLKPSSERDLRLLNTEIDGLTRNLERLQSTINDTHNSLSALIADMGTPGQGEDNDSLRENIRLRQEHLKTLHYELRLERAKQGWMRYFLEGLKR